MLLARPGEYVGRDTLVDELWPDGAPPSAAAIVQVTVSKLRKVLGAEPRLRSNRRGYALDVHPGELDAEQFLTLAASAPCDRAGRRRRLEAALACWRGAAFEDVAGGPLVEAHKLWLEDRRRAVLVELVDLELADGAADTTVARLAAVVAARPADERLSGRLATALGRLGRRDDALDVLRRTRRAVWDEAGMLPSADLLAVYRRITGTDWTTAGPPAQLPAATPDFTGRAAELAELGRLLREPAPVVVHGPAGSGKSVLAVQAAWRARRRFPDGQLVASLRGATPREVLTTFLRQVGAAPAGPAADCAGLIAQWRAYTADRRLLVLLEDAVSERQVRLLLPSGPGCATLVIACHALPGLAGARAVPVTDLSTEDGRALLGAIAGEERLRAEPQAVQEILRYCAGLALAVRVAGATLAARPRMRVAALAARLADEHRRLDELAAGDLAVRPVVTAALRERPAAERSLLRQLAAFDAPVPDWVATALLQCSLSEARDRLDSLVDKHSLTVTTDERYAVPAFDRLVLVEQEEADRAAIRRVLELVARDPVRAELPFLTAAARLACTYGWHELTEQLAGTCTALAGRPWLGRAAHEVAVYSVIAARRRGDPATEADKLVGIGSMHSQHGHWQQARTYFKMAERRYRALGDARGTGAVLCALADVDVDAGDPLAAEAQLREALDLLRAAGDRCGQAVAAAQYGSLAEDLGDLRRAEESFEASMLLAAQGDDSRGYDQAAKRYADVLRRQGRTDRAAQLLSDALGGAVRTGERHWEAHVLRSLGDLHANGGEVADGTGLLDRSLEIFDQIGHRHAAAYTHRSLADARCRAHDWDGAAWHLRAAMDVFRTLRDRRGAGYALLSLGRMRAEAGAQQEAVSALRTSAGLFRELGFPLWELRALHDLNTICGDASERAREVLTKIKN